MLGNNSATYGCSLSSATRGVQIYEVIFSKKDPYMIKWREGYQHS